MQALASQMTASVGRRCSRGARKAPGFLRGDSGRAFNAIRDRQRLAHRLIPEVISNERADTFRSQVAAARYSAHLGREPSALDYSTRSKLSYPGLNLNWIGVWGSRPSSGP